MRKPQDLEFKKLVDAQLAIALEEIGPIEPWLDKSVREWVFEHPLYPESCSGDTKAEVVKKYPLYLRQFIEQRLKGNLAPWVEKKTRGRGGRRAGAGRPKGSSKAPTRTVRLPEDVAVWIKAKPSHLEQIRELIPELALSRIQRASVAAGKDKMVLAEINREIKLARKGRRR